MGRTLDSPQPFKNNMTPDSTPHPPSGSSPRSSTNPPTSQKTSLSDLRQTALDHMYALVLSPGLGRVADRVQVTPSHPAQC